MAGSHRASDTHHLLPRYRNAPLDQAWRNRGNTTGAGAQMVHVDERVYTSTPLGDPHVLRGIPAHAHGVNGAIPGTLPHLKVLELDD